MGWGDGSSPWAATAIKKNIWAPISGRPWRRFGIWESLYLTPSVYAEGGSSRNYRRVIGTRTDGERWSDGVSSVSFRLELGWSFSENFSAFAFVEQYEVVGQAARHAISASSYRCAHNDWTHGGIGLRLKF